MVNPTSVLFIHYHYPPLKNSGIYRNYFLSSSIADLTHHCSVITSDNRKYLPTEEMPIHPRVTVHEVTTLDYRRLIAWMKGKKSKAGAQFSEGTKKSFWMLWAIKIQRSFPFNIFLAEGGLFYIINAYIKACQTIREGNIGIVYSSFMPYADHIVAYCIKRTFSQIHWVADFRDLHVEPIYKNTIWVPFQYWIEKKILAKADLVTCVSDGISHKMRRLHPNVMTLTKGVSKSEGTVLQYDKFTISYVGSLFLDFRDPSLVFRALCELIIEGVLDKSKIQILYAGKDSVSMEEKIRQATLEDIYEDRGMVTRAVAMDIQCRSHINLLLTSSSPDHQGLLTGKLFEYFEAGNPIICLIKGVYDPEIEDIFNMLHAGCIIYDPGNIEPLKNFITTKYLEWIATSKVQPTIDTTVLLQNFSWKGQAEKLISAIPQPYITKQA